MNERSSTAAPDADNPWPGLDAFSEAASRFFNGRETESAELLVRVKRDEPTVLFGQSGLGKTSLLQAGLFPLLREDGYLPIYIRLDHSAASPALIEQIWVALEKACAENGIEAPARTGAETLWEYLHLADSTFWSARNKPLTPVFVLDQFEELFTNRNKPQHERYAFLSAFGDLLANRIPRSLLESLNQQPKEAVRFILRRRDHRFVISLREDFLPNLETLQEEMRVSLQNRMRLQPMTGEQAERAVIVTGGALVDESAATAIVSAVGGAAENSDSREIEPFLLSLFCRELNEKRKRLGRATISNDLLTPGSEREILLEFYKNALRGLDPRVCRFIEEQLLTEGGLRNSRTLEEAEKEGISSAMIDTLVERRLLRREERFRVMRVELTHDQLTRVAMESRRTRRIEEQQLKARVRMRKLLRAVAAMAAVVVAAIVMTFWALNKKQEAQDAQSKAVIAERAAVASQATIATFADYIASAFESGRDTVEQDPRKARDFYEKKCAFGKTGFATANANTARACETARKLDWLIAHVLPKTPRTGLLSTIAGEYTLCELTKFPPTGVLLGTTHMRIERVGDSIRVSGGPAGAWTARGAVHNDGTGYYQWRFEDPPQPYGRTAFMIDSAGTLYGHVLALTKNSPIENWWYVAQKGDPSVCKLP